MSSYRRGGMHICDVVPDWTPDEGDDFLVAYVLADHQLYHWDGTNWSILVIENRTSDPASPVSGQMWLRTDL